MKLYPVKLLTITCEILAQKNIIDILKNHEEKSLMVSKDDVHLNDKAHLLIAEFLKNKLLYKLNSL